MWVVRGDVGKLSKVKGRSMEVKQVRKKRRSFIVECLVGEEEEFKLNGVCDGEPVQVMEDRRDMVLVTSACE